MDGRKGGPILIEVGVGKGVPVFGHRQVELRYSVTHS